MHPKKIVETGYLNGARDGYEFPTLACNLTTLEARHGVCSGDTAYKLGVKPTLAVQRPPRADCSGYVGWILSIAAPVFALKQSLFSDIGGVGTWLLAQWCEKCGFKRSDKHAAKRRDGALRLAVMLKSESVPMGHIALILDGRTIECYGLGGAGSREWTGKGWQAYARVFVLTAPIEEKKEEKQ